MAGSNAKAVGIGLVTVLAVAGTLITKWEGVRYAPYYDSVGVLTVCYGHTGPDIVPGKQYTKAECRALLDADMTIANGHVRRCIGAPMLVQEEAALTSLVFNVGPRAVCGSTIQRKALANDWPGACAAIDLYNRGGGRVIRGLVLRRADERHLCETGT